MLVNLMNQSRQVMRWWHEAARVLQQKGIQLAVTGAVAANQYMPPRHTGDLDLAVRLDDLRAAGDALRGGRWKLLGDLNLYAGLRGTAWEKGGHEVDIVGLPGAWGDAAVADAQTNLLVDGLPTLSRGYVVTMKLISARPQDTADISRIGGAAPAEALDDIRRVVRRWRPQDVEDLEHMINLGQMEWRR
jgi:hypothetical protein